MKQQYVLIVDAGDAEGKNYFIDRLVKYLGNCITIKNNYKPKTKKDRDVIKLKYLDIIETISKIKEFDYIILNRFYPSELVYSGIKRNYDASKDPFYKRLESKILKQKAIYVWIMINEKENIVKERLKNRGDDFISESEIHSIKEKYKEVFNNSKIARVEILSSGTDIKDLIDNIKLVFGKNGTS